MSSVNLLSICNVPKIAIKDGYTGANARIFLPFYGYWFASGQQLAFPDAVVPQDPFKTLSGTNKPNDFVKAAGVCLGV